MSLLDLLKQEYMKGTVIEKYKLPDGNIALIIDQDGTHRRYHVRFEDDYRSRPCIENLFGLLKEPFSGKTNYLEGLINKGDHIEFTASASKSPFREAYELYHVSKNQPTPSGTRRLPSYGSSSPIPTSSGTYQHFQFEINVFARN